MKTTNRTSLCIGFTGALLVIIYFACSIAWTNHKWSNYKKDSRPIMPTTELQKLSDIAHSNAMVRIEKRRK